MDKQTDSNTPRLTSGSLLARNVYLNLVGQGLAVAVAVLSIPLVIGALGTERFGILTLAWVVMNYFGLFDLGMGMATTKFVAEYHARKDMRPLRDLVWNSVGAHAVLGLLTGTLVALLASYLTESVLNVPSELLREATNSFYLLAASVPILVAASALRGVLEAVQRFDLVNYVKIPASLFTYLSPLFVVLFTHDLTVVIGLLVVSRGVMLAAYLLLCLRVLPVLVGGFRFKAGLVKPLLGLGGWLAASSLIFPTVVALDRFVIGALASLSAVAYYATPYEVVTKLWIFSGSLVSVLFPAFAVLAVGAGQDLRQLYTRAFKYLLVLIVPAVGLLLALTYDLLNLWIGVDFAQNSTTVAKWLAIGVLIHALAALPITALQSTGRADVSAKLQLVSLPFYALGVWYLVESMGIIGVAVAWTARVAITSVMLFVAAERLLPSGARDFGSKLPRWNIIVILGFLLLLLGVGALPPDVLMPKLLLVTVLFAFFLSWTWLFFLSASDRKIVSGRAVSFLRRTK